MKIVITAEGNNLDAPASRRFGRCPMFIFVETETMAYEALPNPAISASGGAGIQAAQFVVEQGIGALLTNNVGPNASEIFQAANVSVYLNGEATVRAAVEAFRDGRLALTRGPNVEAHSGMRRGPGRGMGQGRGATRVSAPAREAEITNLKSLAADLRQQLAGVIDRIEKLEEESQ